MNKRILMLFCAMVLSMSPLFAQVKVSGVISDQNGDPIPFASVVVKGTSTGTAADADGNFSISVPSAKSVLVFSSIGFANEEVAPNGKTKINVTLGPDSEALDEVMVVAYGQATKSSFTGSAGKVSGEKIELVPSTNPLNTLNGSTPGIRLTSALGQPGSDATITVRGIGSLNGNTDPLIVLDGMIYSGVLSSIPAGDIESITVLKDAASTALYGSRAANGVIMITTKQGKGETPTITAKISHGFVSRETGDYPRLNDKQYMESYWRAYYNGYLENNMSDADARAQASANVVAALNYNDAYMAWKGQGVTASNIVSTEGVFNPNAQLLWPEDVDWQGGVEQVGQVQDYTVSAAGRTKHVTYFGSVNYTDQQGYMIGSGFERFSARANVSAQKKWLKIGVNLQATTSTQKGMQSTSQGDLSNPFHITKKMPPMYPIHRHYADGSYELDANGNKIYDFGEGYGTGAQAIPARAIFSTTHSIKYCEDRVSDRYRHNFNIKPYAEVTFLKDFKASINAAIYNADYQSHTATPHYAEKSTGSTSTTIEISNTQTFALNELLTWNHSFGEHHVDALIGHETNKWFYQNTESSKKNQIIIGKNFEFDNYAEQDKVSSGYQNNYRTEGYFARVNYDYASRYFISGSFRRDGSSKFYSTARWGNFWSVGGSWIMSNEKWLKDTDWLDQLKIRASIGTVGSDDLGSYYPYMALYTANQNGAEPGYTQNRESPGNLDLQWEISHNWDAAVEFAFFKRRLTGSIEYFHRQTSNLLMDVTLASSTGLTSYRANQGGLLNHGLEFAVAGDIVRTKNVTWNLGVNGSIIKNVITDLPIPAYTVNSNFNKVEQGHSVYEWWLYQWEGVDPADGLCLYQPGDVYFDENGAIKAEYLNADGSYAEGSGLRDSNGKLYTTTIANAKEEFSGSSLPKIYGGITTNLKVYRFTLDVNLYYQLGGYTYDRAYSNLMAPGVHSYELENVHTDMLNAWTTPGQQTNVPKFVLKGSANAENVKGLRSTQWRTSTNSLEINNITLSYDFSKKVCNAIKISALKLYASADHLYMWNARKGMYTNYSLSNYDSGGSRYTPARTINIGLNITF